MNKKLFLLALMTTLGASWGCTSEMINIRKPIKAADGGGDIVPRPKEVPVSSSIHARQKTMKKIFETLQKIDRETDRTHVAEAGETFGGVKSERELFNLIKRLHSREDIVKGKEKDPLKIKTLATTINKILQCKELDAFKKNFSLCYEKTYIDLIEGFKVLSLILNDLEQKKRNCKVIIELTKAVNCFSKAFPEINKVEQLNV